MARIRTIKPEFWQHPKVTRVSRDARLLFLGLLNEADDDGRMRFSPKRLAGVLFPDDEDVDAALLTSWANELAHAGLVEAYEVDGAKLLVITGFTEHQKINRPSPSRLPRPPHGTISEQSVSDTGPITDDSLGERNREQGTGKGTGSIAPTPSDAMILDAPSDIVPMTRKRDELAESIAASCGYDLRSLTESARGAFNRAVKDLRSVNADPDEVDLRARVYRSRFSTPLTPMALAKNWPALTPDAVMADVARAPTLPKAAGAIARARGRS